MPQLTFTLSVSKNRIVFTVAEFLPKIYFGALPIDPIALQQYPTAYLESFIIAAQEQVEDDFSLAINKSLIIEKAPFDVQYAETYLDTPVSYLIENPLLLLGGINSTFQVSQDNLSGSENSRKYRGRSIQVKNISYLSNRIFSSYSGNPYASIPDFWTVYYTSGYDVAPSDLIEYAEKLVDWNIANIAGDFVGLGGGVASQSISLDGLSQSVSTTNSSTSAAFGARMMMIKKWMDLNIKGLHSKYNISVL